MKRRFVDDDGSMTMLSSFLFSTSVSASGRLQEELAELNEKPIPDCFAGPIGDNLYNWIAIVIGPPGTPYEGGVFFIEFIFPNDHPFKPPKVVFKTRIFHSNIDIVGNLGLDILEDKWSPTITISKILLAIRTMLFQTAKQNASLAAEWTRRYAT